MKYHLEKPKDAEIWCPDCVQFNAGNCGNDRNIEIDVNSYAKPCVQFKEFRHEEQKETWLITRITLTLKDLGWGQDGPL